MSETLNKALAFLDAAVAELDEPTQLAPNHKVVELRRHEAEVESDHPRLPRRAPHDVRS